MAYSIHFLQTPTSFEQPHNNSWDIPQFGQRIAGNVDLAAAVFFFLYMGYPEVLLATVFCANSKTGGISDSGELHDSLRTTYLINLNKANPQ